MRPVDYLPLVATVNAARVLAVVGQLLGVDHAEFGELALSAAPGAGGLTLLPYLDGERTPNRPHATGVLRGLTSGGHQSGSGQIRGRGAALLVGRCR